MKRGDLHLVKRPDFHNVRRRRALQRLWYRYGIVWTGAVAVGICAVGYAHLVNIGYQVFLSEKLGRFWMPLIITPIIGGVCASLTRSFFRGAEGSGIPQVIAVLSNTREIGESRLLSFRVSYGKVAVSVLAMMGGFAIGREGPTVQIGATIMYGFRRFYPKRLRATFQAALEKRLILAGAASALAAAFNTPLAAIVFAIEQLSHGLDLRTARVIVIATILSDLVALAIDGNYSFFTPAAPINVLLWPTIISVLFTGALTGIAGGAFTWISLNTERWLPNIVLSFRGRRPVAFGVICGAVVAVLGVVSGGNTYGSGYTEATALVAGHMSVDRVYPFAKCLSLIASSLVGAPGGIFVPSLAIGAGIGQNIHEFLNNVSSNLAITLAMVGYLSAVTQGPITAFVIVTEMNNAHVLITPLMATSLIASAISRTIAPPLYETLAARYTK